MFVTISREAGAPACEVFDTRLGVGAVVPAGPCVVTIRAELAPLVPGAVVVPAIENVSPATADQE